MNDKNNTMTFLVCLLILISFIGGSVIGSCVKKQQAIDAGVAFYNPTNAVFTWKTNCVN